MTATRHGNLARTGCDTRAWHSERYVARCSARTHQPTCGAGRSLGQHRQFVAAIDDYPAAVTNLQHAVAAYRSAFGDNHARLARALARLSRLQSLNHEFIAAKTNAELAVATARRGDDPETLAVCLLDAAKSHSNAGQPTPEAISLLREAMELRRNTVPHLMFLLDSTRLLVKALEGLALENRQDEATTILEEELKKAPRDGDLLRLRRAFARE